VHDIALQSCTDGHEYRAVSKIINAIAATIAAKIKLLEPISKSPEEDNKAG
jgi:hypothetical protein